MPNLDCKNYELIIPDFAEDSVVANSIAPFSRLVCCEPFPMCAWICAAVDVFQEPRNYDASDARVHFRKLLISSF